MKYLANFIRYILFIPVCILAVGVFYYGLSFLPIFTNLNNHFWVWMLIFLLGGIIIPIVYALFTWLMSLVVSISPNRRFGAVFGIFSILLNGIWCLYEIWRENYDYSDRPLKEKIVFTLAYTISGIVLCMSCYSTLSTEDSV